MGKTIAALMAVACLMAGRAEALLYTYDLGSNRGPITLSFEADDDEADTRLAYEGRTASLTSLLDITLILDGQSYTLIGSVDPDVGLLDTRRRTLSFVVNTVVRPGDDTLTTVNLTFSARMRNIRTLGDLFAYFDTARVTGGDLRIAPAAVPVPGAMALFAGGLAGIGAARRRLG